MKRPLLDVLFASEKRKNVLLYLSSGPKKMDTILNHLRTNRPALLPQTRILEDHHLVTQSGDVYQLTTIGEVIAREMQPLIGTVDALDTDIDYWGTHRLDFIPEHLLERIGELSGCEITEPGSLDMHDINHQFYLKSLDSEELNFICRFMYPNFPHLITQWAKRGIDLSMIVDDGLLKKIKSSYADEFRSYIENGYVRLFHYPEEIGFMKFSQSDRSVMLILFNERTGYDNKTLLGFDNDSIGWGAELFENYRQRSVPVKEI